MCARVCVCFVCCTHVSTDIHISLYLTNKLTHTFTNALTYPRTPPARAYLRKGQEPILRRQDPPMAAPPRLGSLPGPWATTTMTSDFETLRFFPSFFPLLYPKYPSHPILRKQILVNRECAVGYGHNTPRGKDHEEVFRLIFSTRVHVGRLPWWAWRSGECVVLGPLSCPEKRVAVCWCAR